MGFLSTFNKGFLSDGHHPAEKFSVIFSDYLQRLAAQGGSLAERQVTLLVRSPLAPAARAFALYADGLAREQIRARIILAKLTPGDLLCELSVALDLVHPGECKSDHIRHINVPALLNAHEQLVLGSSTCWTGDVLRRPEENRNGLDLLENDASQAVKLAEFAFDAIWSSAKSVPGGALTGRRDYQPLQRPQFELLPPGLAGNSTPVLRTSRRALTRH